MIQVVAENIDFFDFVFGGGTPGKAQLRGYSLLYT